VLPAGPIWFQLATGTLLIFILNELRLRARRVTPIPGGRQFHEKKPKISDLPHSIRLAGVALILEIPFHFWTVPQGPVSKLLIIGDSVTAGLNDGDDTWPRQLSRE